MQLPCGIESAASAGGPDQFIHRGCTGDSKYQLACVHQRNLGREHAVAFDKALGAVQDADAADLTQEVLRSVAEAMKDGTDAVSDWPLLNALLSTASGATWVSFHHGGGVGMGYSQPAGLVIVCDGTEAADRRIARVLWNDPASGVMRHADAGYDEAIDCAREHGLKLPMLHS